MPKQDTITQKLKELDFSIPPTDAVHRDKEIFAYPSYMKEVILPTQGFKIHISSTIINSEKIFDIVAPFLTQHAIAFKVVASNNLLDLLNQTFFGYTQIGKFITVYPTSDEEFVELVKKLDDMLIDFEGPRIPSDKRVSASSIVHYRYGAIQNNDNTIQKPDGNLVKDERDPSAPIPSWIKDPIRPIDLSKQTDVPHKLLLDRFLLLKVLKQRGKGIVSSAIDLKYKDLPKPKTVILKEARALGALTKEGVDAISRLEKQYAIMKTMCVLDICPKPIELIPHEGRAFLIMEAHGDKNLQDLILDKPPKEDLYALFFNIAEKISLLHKHGIYFFDLSLDNVLIDEDRSVRLSDFEYSVKEGVDSFEGWMFGTPGFTPNHKLMEEMDESFTQKLIYKDLFALSSILLAMLNTKWFDNILSSELLIFVTNEEIKKAIQELPKNLHPICLKAHLLEGKGFKTVKDFIKELKEVYPW